MRRCWRRLPHATSWIWWIPLVVAVLAGGILLSWDFWSDLHRDNESLSATIRNLGLVIGGVTAILLALWRSLVAAVQTETAQQGLRNERYQKGAEMLGSDVLSVRLGGIYTLQRLAHEHPERYHVQIMRLFCAFVRHPIRDERIERSEDEKIRGGQRRPIREDVQAILDIIFARDEQVIAIERRDDYRLDLSDAMLQGVVIDGANLSNALLVRANLSGGWIRNSNLSGAILDGGKMHKTNFGAKANLQGSRLIGAILTEAEFYEVNASSANFSGVRFSDAQLYMVDFGKAIFSTADLSGTLFTKVYNLTAEQLVHTGADQVKPPGFIDVVDAETNKPLVWSGMSRQPEPKRDDALLGGHG